MKKYIIFSILLSFAIFSCQRKTDIGYNVLPQGDLLNTVISDTASIAVYSIRNDSVITSETPELLLGEYQDPIFGYTKASFVLQFSNSIQYINFKDTDIVDSVVLSLPYNQNTGNLYGNSNDEQILKVYQILDVNLDNSKQYYNTEDTSAYIGELVGAAAFNPFPDDSILNVRLTNSFGNFFIQADESNYESGEAFYNFFKGLYVCTETNNGDGTITKFNINDDMLLTIYFHKNDESGEEYKYQITANKASNVHFNIINHDYSSANFAGTLNDESGTQDSVAYIQSGGGYFARIKFPYLEKLKDSGNIVINRAELIIKTAPEYLTFENTYPAINHMFVYGYISNDSLSLVPDYIAQTSYAGELYNEKTYKFDIASYIQNIIDGKTENKGLNLYPASDGNNFTRSVITTGKNSNPIQLIITYTKL